MTEQNLSLLYNEHESYRALRDSDSLRYALYKIEVEQWKIPHLLSVIPQGFSYASIAEIGCASGEIVATFPSEQEELQRFGFDISSKNIDCAKKRFPFVTFSEQDFRKSKLRVDLVIISDVLEHVPDDVSFLKRLKQLSPCVVANISLEKCWLYRNRQYGLSDFALRLRAYNEVLALKIVNNAGFVVVEKKLAWFVEQPCYGKHLKLSRSTESLSMFKRIRRSIYDLLLINRWFRRKYLPGNLFCFLHANE